jgi:short subunit dehydrogenase-like uncharacterized protein
VSLISFVVFFTLFDDVYEGVILAQQLASLGAKLILSARNEAELNQVKSQLKGTNDNLTYSIA